MAKKYSKNWDAAAQMPELRHASPGGEFDIRKSEAARWLVSRPEIMQAVFDHVKDRGLIVYDPEAGTWEGRDR